MNIQTDRQSADGSEVIRRLAEWTLAPDPAWSDPRVLQQTKLILLDTVACAIAALEVPTPRRVAALVDMLGGTPMCSIIGRAEKAPILSAVLMNGALVRSLDFNDVQFFLKEGKLSVAGHCSDNIPAALAAAEHHAARGEATLSAIAMGYELFGRLRRLMPFTSAWDGTSVSGLVAAAIYGRLAGFDAETQANGLAMGAIRCATPSVVRWGKLSGAKNLANSLIAQSGVQGAMLAGLGITGPLEVLDHRGGLFQVFDPALGLDSLWAPLDDAPYIMTSGIKPYACIGTAQTTVAAARKLHPLVKDRLDRITRINVVMADLPMIRKQQGEVARRYPMTREAADHSFTFLPAVAMAEGAMTDDQFRERRWENPDMVRLIEMTELSVEPGLAERAPGSMPSRIEVTFDDGSQVAEECLFHPGHSDPDRGLDADAVCQKYDEVVRPHLSDAKRVALREAVLDCEHRDIGALMTQLRDLG
ncbi:MmgE/PrpD family protein [Puniceibacterium confluentis]|uniref:MmgE/PrpD family protein n=1 Tax=Puniceibacterium confluentis TaxID=1958944 RepID=UPI001646BC0B|nr:MmgE/PrpD family protein [Puniceibacterium confluentis]